MLERLNQAMEHIERHLGQDIEVEELARIAATSEYHLRRMFSALAGMVDGNPVATAQLDRSEALLDGDEARALTAAAAFEAAGCRYQAARTLLLAGGAHAAAGEAALAGLGLGLAPRIG